MPQCECTVTIERPAAEVYAYLADFRNQHEWRPDVQASELKSGAVGSVGATYEYSQPWMRRTYVTVVENDRLEPNRTVGFRTVSKTSMPVSGVFTLDEQGGGTAVTFACEMRPRGLARVATPFIGRGMRKTVEGYLENLKGAVESK